MIVCAVAPLARQLKKGKNEIVANQRLFQTDGEKGVIDEASTSRRNDPFGGMCEPVGRPTAATLQPAQNH